MVPEQQGPETAPGAGLDQLILRPVRGHHAFESCVEQLATAIRLGVYPPGSTLPPERELASMLAVSRATLRQAMTALRTAGVVRTRRGRGGGTVVLPQSSTQPPDWTGLTGAGEKQGLVERLPQLLDALVFRAVVEPGAAELAAQRCARGELDDADRAELVEALEQVCAAKGRAEHRRCDSRLHLRIASLSGSARTSAAVAEVQDDLHTMLEAIPVLPVNIAHSTEQHRAIVAAVLDGDPRRARRVMGQHCADTAALLRGLLATPPAAPSPKSSQPSERSQQRATTRPGRASDA